MSDDNNVKKSIYRRWWIWLIAIILLMIIAYTATNGKPAKWAPTAIKEKSELQSSEKLTLDKYNKITKGMQYEDAVKIIGVEVEPESEAGSTSCRTLTYRYIGTDKVNGDVGANAVFVFQGGKLTTKAQLGLK